MRISVGSDFNSGCAICLADEDWRDCSKPERSQSKEIVLPRSELLSTLYLAHFLVSLINR